MLAIRNAGPSDLSAVAEIHVASWQAAYVGMISDDILGSLSVKERLQTWKEWNRLPCSELFLACRRGVILGFCRLVRPSNSDAIDQYGGLLRKDHFIPLPMPNPLCAAIGYFLVDKNSIVP